MSYQTPQRSALLHKLQAEDFTLYEVALFLDGHPKNQKALCYYAEHKKLYDALKKEYEQHFGPLSLYSSQKGGQWDWTDGPWPWEKEAN